MKILVNGKDAPTFSAKQERALSLAKEQAEVEGSVLSVDVASATYINRLRVFFIAFGAIVAIILTGIALLADPRDGWLIYPVAAVIGLLLLIVMLIIYRRRVANWRTRLAERTAALPPAGTAIRLDAAGLAFGDQTLAWPQLSIDTLDVLKVSGEDSTTWLIERLLLQAPGRKIALDTTMMTNPRAIVDNAYRRLRIIPSQT